MPEHPTTPRWHDDRGSLPLALLVLIIVGGLTTAMLARTTAEQQSTRFDTEFTSAVHAAEEGLNVGLFELNNRLVVGDTVPPRTEQVNGFSYTWQAARQGDGSWKVESTGVGPGGVSRTVTADVRDRPIFDLSLATHLGIDFSGGNKADSYSSATSPQRRCSPPTNANCYGIIASNGNINMGSSSTTTNFADRVHVFDMANPLNNGPARCGPSGSVYCAPPFRFDFDEPLNIRGSVPLVEAMEAACEAAGAYTDWKASTQPLSGSGNNATATLNPANHAANQVNVVDPVNGQNRTVLCIRELTLDKHVTLAASVTRTNPLLINVRDRMFIEGAVRVNCAGCDAGFPPSGSMPSARRLQVFTLAQDTPVSGNNVLAAVQIRQHAKFGGAIYGPDASCGNQQSNAQVEIYGSIICKSVLNQGGWQFHYDEDLAEGLRTGEYVVARWAEEQG